MIGEELNLSLAHAYRMSNGHRELIHLSGKVHVSLIFNIS